MSVLVTLAGPILSIVDKIVGNKADAEAIKSAITSQLIDQNSDLHKAASDIIVAEASGESWLQRNWRPITMMGFLACVVGYWFGFVPRNMPVEAVEGMFTLLQIGIGGYIGGRTVEKAVSRYMDRG